MASSEMSRLASVRAGGLGPAAARRPPARTYRRMRDTRWGYLFLSPAVLILLVFTLAPALFVLYISFFHWNLLDAAQSRPVGLGNYRALLHSTGFAHSLLVSAYFVVVNVGAGTVLSLAIAVLLNRRVFGRGAARLAVFSPYVTPIIATSIMWVWIFNPQFGLANTVLHTLGLPELAWLESTTWALPAIIIFTLWHSLGFTVIIFLAGLTTISQELGEAARVDGANSWQEFRWVTLPQLIPTVLFVVIITTIGSLQAFTQFYSMAAGGPLAATTTTSFLLYQQAFVFFHTGSAAAIAVVLFVIIVALTLVQLRVSRRRGADA